MDQPTAKRILNELIKREDLNNKHCIDCGNPNPQWASLGGNKPFKDFMKSYPKDQGGYNEGMEPYETYHSWAAAQYRSKLDADLAGTSWSPSPPPADFAAPSGGPIAAQALRKSRSGRSGTGNISRNNSSSPASLSGAATPVGMDQKARNEAFFESLGGANAARRDDLPPSQGGRYQGFGSTPAPSSSPAYGISSHAAPTISDFQDDPVAAIGKGWSLFSSVIASATRTVNENVIQPGMERVMDPEFQASVRGYAAEAGKRATFVGSAANEWGKHQLGVDVGGQVSGVVSSLTRDRAGYNSLSQEGYNSNGASYNEHGHDDDDFFDQFESTSSSRQQAQHQPSSSSTTAAAARAPKKDDDGWDDWEPAPSKKTTAAPAPKKDDGWDDWQDF